MRKLLVLAVVATVVLLIVDRVGHPFARSRLAPSPPPNSVNRIPTALSTRNFAGYNVAISSTTVGGDWKVPTISPGSNDGTAATWVDLDDYSPRSSLIQAGVVETQTSGTRTYVAFWSDTASDYHAHLLAKTLEPGDRIAVKISRIRSAWTISIIDDTHPWRYRTQLRNISDRPFAYVAWLQEDPMIGGATIPYPEMALVTFSNLTVNGVTPHISSSSALDMHLPNGAVMTPSLETSDGFTLRLVRP